MTHSDPHHSGDSGDGSDGSDGSDGEVLFRSRVVRQTACPSRYALLAGRAVPCPPAQGGLCPDLPPSREAGDDWPMMVDALLRAAADWPPMPLRITIQHYRIHPVDSSPRAFVEALHGAAWTLWGEGAHGLPATPSWCRVEVCPTPARLPAGVQALVDAGHLGQALEVVLALCPERLHRLLLEGVFTETPGVLPALVAGCLGARTEVVAGRLLEGAGWALADRQRLIAVVLADREAGTVR